MKMKSCCVFLLCIFMIGTFMNVMKVRAVHTGFEIADKPIEEKEAFIANVNILSIDKEPNKEAISCFAVNSNHFLL